MAMKGARRIVVDGEHLIYVLRGRSRYGRETAPVLSLTIRHRHAPVRFGTVYLRSLLYRGTPDEGFAEHKNSVTPSMIAEIVRLLRDGRPVAGTRVGDWEMVP